MDFTGMDFKGLKYAITSSAGMGPYIDRLRGLGMDLKVVDTVTGKTDEVIKAYKDVDIAICVFEYFTAEALNEFKGRLKMIARHGLGFEKIDIPVATRNGVCVTTTPGMLASAVAETAFTLTLECGRRIAKRDAELQQGEWKRSPLGTQLENKTVGIVGFGNIGRKYAQYCKGFDCTLLAYDIHYDEDALKRLNVEPVSLEELAQRSDIISVSCPLNEHTRGLISEDIIRMMKKSAYIVNTSRGATIDEKAMIRALDEGRIAGAGLDVFEQEPLPKNNPLRGRENVVMSPHVASNTVEGFRETQDDILVSIGQFLKGEIPKKCLNPDYVKYVK